MKSMEKGPDALQPTIMGMVGARLRQKGGVTLRGNSVSVKILDPRQSHCERDAISLSKAPERRPRSQEKSEKSNRWLEKSPGQHDLEKRELL